MKPTSCFAIPIRQGCESCGRLTSTAHHYREGETARPQLIACWGCCPHCGSTSTYNDSEQFNPETSKP